MYENSGTPLQGGVDLLRTRLLKVGRPLDLYVGGLACDRIHHRVRLGLGHLVGEGDGTRADDGLTEPAHSFVHDLALQVGHEDRTLGGGVEEWLRRSIQHFCS